jgi:ABC-type phosphate transport system permease subunit
MNTFVLIIAYAVGIIVFGVIVGYFIHKMEQRSRVDDKIKFLEEFEEKMKKINLKK